MLEENGGPGQDTEENPPRFDSRESFLNYYNSNEISKPDDITFLIMIIAVFKSLVTTDGDGSVVV